MWRLPSKGGGREPATSLALQGMHWRPEDHRTQTAGREGCVTNSTKPPGQGLNSSPQTPLSSSALWWSGLNNNLSQLAQAPSVTCSTVNGPRKLWHHPMMSPSWAVRRNAGRGMAVELTVMAEDVFVWRSWEAEEGMRTCHTAILCVLIVLYKWLVKFEERQNNIKYNLDNIIYYISD